MMVECARSKEPGCKGGQDARLNPGMDTPRRAPARVGYRRQLRRGRSSLDTPDPELRFMDPLRPQGIQGLRTADAGERT
jgi:hypothetical protein